MKQSQIFTLLTLIFLGILINLFEFRYNSSFDISEFIFLITMSLSSMVFTTIIINDKVKKNSDIYCIKYEIFYNIKKNKNILDEMENKFLVYENELILNDILFLYLNNKNIDSSHRIIEQKIKDALYSNNINDIFVYVKRTYKK